MIEVYQRNARWMNLKPYCHHSGEHDHIEVCEWDNGEGFDVTINKRTMSFTLGEYEAMQVLVAYKE